jgi:hypothetical protein
VVAPAMIPTRGDNMPPKPPSMRTLMEDPLYRSYMKRVPTTPHAFNTSGEPWQLWIDAGAGRWRTATYTSYKAVWPTFVQALKAQYPDVTITSRRVFYAPPGEWYKVRVRKPRRPTPDNPGKYKLVIEDRWRQLFFWDVGLEWCGRCRRPVYWMPLFADHHALRRFPAVTDDENRRCTICGIRWCATPPISQMVRS